MTEINYSHNVKKKKKGGKELVAKGPNFQDTKKNKNINGRVNDAHLRFDIPNFIDHSALISIILPSSGGITVLFIERVICLSF